MVFTVSRPKTMGIVANSADSATAMSTIAHSYWALTLFSFC